MNKLSFSDVYLETKRLILRSFTSSDKEEFFKILQDEKIYKTLPEDHMYNEQEVSEIIDWFVATYNKNEKEHVYKIPLAIVLKETDEIIGDIGIGQLSFDEKETEIFYFINSRYWNNGYVSEAMDSFMKYIGNINIVDKLVAAVVPGNTASQRILLKNGFSEIDNPYNNDNRIYELRLT